MARVSIPVEKLKASALPAVCLLSGAREGVVPTKIELGWDGRDHAPATEAAFVALALLGVPGLLIHALTASSLEWTVKATLPFEPEAHRAWARGERNVVSLVVAAAGAFVLGVLGAIAWVVFEEAPVPGVVFLAGCGGSIVLLVAALAVRTSTPRFRVLRVHDQVVDLDVPSKAAAEAIVESLKVS